MQNTLITDLTKKYGFDGIHIDEPTIRYIELLLGLSYGLDAETIDSYMSADSKNILEIDIHRLCTILEIPFPEEMAGADLVRSFKEQVYGLRDSAKKTPNDQKYPHLMRLLLEEGKAHNISAFKLDIINEAIKQDIEEEYLMKLIKKGYDERELQRLVELYRITHETKHPRRHGR